MKWLKRIGFTILFLAVGVALLLGWATLADYRPPVAVPSEKTGQAPEIGPGDSVFSVITWNLGYFGLGKECDFFFDGGTMTRPGNEQYRLYSKNLLSYLDSSEKADFLLFPGSGSVCQEELL